VLHLSAADLVHDDDVRRMVLHRLQQHVVLGFRGWDLHAARPADCGMGDSVAPCNRFILAQILLVQVPFIGWHNLSSFGNATIGRPSRVFHDADDDDSASVAKIKPVKPRHDPSQMCSLE
jgi:hypothetical protein